MRLTSWLSHGKRFWWGKGWGDKPRKNTDHFYWKMQWNAKRRRPLEVISQTLPDGVTPIDPNQFLKKDLHSDNHGPQHFLLPWPYSPRPIKGSKDDPNYQEESVYLFERNKIIIEPVNLPLYFSNSLLEKGAPISFLKTREMIEVNSTMVDLFQSRINWALTNDTALRKLPINREFPYIDQRPPRQYGIATERKENHVLQSVYDFASSWTSKQFGFSSNVILQRITSPHSVLPLERDGKRVILDLECDFITLLSSSSKEITLDRKLFDNNFEASTHQKALQSIHPLSWEVGFNQANFYPTDYEFKIPANSSIQTIFLSKKGVLSLSAETLQGRAILFCYGYALQQAKMWGQTEYLKKPITIQCIYTCIKTLQIGVAFFQLNTCDFDNQTVRNQVWLSEPRSLLDQSEEAIKDLLAAQSHGIYNIE